MKKIYYQMLLLMTMFMVSGCSTAFFDINDDPNNPTVVPNQYILTSGIAESLYNVGGYYQAIGGFWSQHYAQSTGASQWASWEEMSLDEVEFDRQFRLMYAGALQDLQVVKERSLASSDWSYYLISTLIQSYDFGLLADLYGQVPFSEALKGTANLTPHYEQGAAITDSLINRIDLAMSKDQTALTASAIGSPDLVFQGDMDKWTKFGNTLKLKLMLRYVNIDANKYKTQIQALLAENNFLDESAAMTAFKKEENGRNPFYETFLSRLSGNIVASKTLLDFVKNAGDARLDSIFIAPVDKDGNSLPQVGLGQGRYKADSQKYPNIKSLSTPKFSSLYPAYFFTLPEVDFLIAEAEFRYGSDANAQAAYVKGIQDSYALNGVTTAQPELYATGATYAYDGLKSIITQKWVAAANRNAIESFIDFNRTGYPDFFVISAVSSIGNTFPQRLLFPDSERQSNPNTPTRISIDVKSWYAK